MVQKSPRMVRIEAQLAEDPNDAFLQYGLAMEYASLGDDATAAELLQRLISAQPYVPAFLQAGQILNRLGKISAAMDVLRKGIEAARKQNDLHALGEMQGFLDAME